jgi:hypothetical protein
MTLIIVYDRDAGDIKVKTRSLVVHNRGEIMTNNRGNSRGNAQNFSDEDRSRGGMNSAESQERDERGRFAESE